MKNTLKQWIKEKSQHTISFRRLPGTELLAPYCDNAKHLLRITEPANVLAFKPEGINRDPLLNAKFQKMIQIAYESLPEYLGFKSREAFRKEVLIHAGYYEPFVIVIEGMEVEIRKAKSIAFHNMDEAEFRQLFKMVHITLIKKYRALLPPTFIKDFF